LDQLALAALIESGRYDRHLRRMREVYRRRRDALTEAVAEHAPALLIVGLQAGCHVVLELPDGVSEEAVVEAALRRGVRVYGLSRYRVDAPGIGRTSERPALMMGFGNVDTTRIRRGVAVLAEALVDVG
jgi:GntR family transcriptional regulator/MocR family aminotransferase